MDEVEELIAQLRRAVKEHSGWEPSASVLERTSWKAADKLEALTKALTISPEKLRNAARAFDPTAWRARDTKRDSVAYGRRRKASLRSVRAVAVELGLKVNG